MRFLSIRIILLLSILLMDTGCSSEKSPMTPAGGEDPGITGKTGTTYAQTHLWGCYDVYVDIPAQSATVVADRGGMFTANVVNFINGKPANLKFKINGTLVTATHVDVDIDVGITHPFSGLNQYNGYDVRGIFIGNGSLPMKYNSDLKYAAFGSADQVMYDYNAIPGDLHPGLGMPDGYTRWYNKAEFPTSGLFGYTKGLFATPGFNPTATLNPYKYFADNLSVTGDAWTFLTTTAGSGVFSAGTTNTRNYYLRFPNSGGGVRFAYAVIANWKGEPPSDHPSNAPEACALKTAITPDLFYQSPEIKGGKLILDMNFPNKWGSQPSKIFIESTVLLNPYQLSASEMIPYSSGPGYSTYNVEITPDNLVKKDGNEVWVIAQYDDFNYTNSFGVPNSAGADKLAACFRYDLPVASTSYASLEVTAPNGGESLYVGDPFTITWTSASLGGNVRIEFSNNSGSSWPIVLADDAPNTGTFNFNPSSAHITNNGRIKITSKAIPSVFDTSNADFTVSHVGITVTAPNGGEGLYVSVPFNITWNPGSLGGNVRIEFSNNSGSSWPIVLADDAPNTGTFNFNPSSAHITNNGRIKITSKAIPSVFDTSNADFTVSNAGITVIAPNGGETWHVAKPYLIRWSSGGFPGNVRIDLSLNGGSSFPVNLFANTPNDGSENWSPLVGQISSQARIRISSVNFPTIFDDSNGNFTITNLWIEVEEPNGGERLPVLTAFPITWDSGTSGDNVKIEYSTNGGSTYSHVVIASTLNDGVHMWTPASGHISTQGRIKISYVSNNTIFDTSNANFTVITIYNCSPSLQSYNSAYALTTSATKWNPDDDDVIKVPIGFTFNYGGANYTHVNISSNGGVNFDYEDDWYDDCTYDYEERAIWPLGDDLYDGDSPSTYFVRYQRKTVGTNDVFIIVWNLKDMDDYTNRIHLVLFNTTHPTHDPFLMQWPILPTDVSEKSAWYYYRAGYSTWDEVWKMCCLYDGDVPENRGVYIAALY